MSIGDLVTVAAELEALLFDDPVLTRPHVVPLPQIESLNLEALVDANPTAVAKAMVLEAADTEWERALRTCKVKTEARSGILNPY